MKSESTVFHTTLFTQNDQSLGKAQGSIAETRGRRSLYKERLSANMMIVAEAVQRAVENELVGTFHYQMARYPDFMRNIS